MSTFAIDEARKLSRTGSIAIIAGTLLGATSSAFSADLPYDGPPYGPGYYYRNSSYNPGCYRCSCCGRRVGPAVERDFVEERPPIPVVERLPVAERHWVQRDYIERRYPYYPWPRYAYPKRYHYSYYPGPGADLYSYDPRPPVEPRRSGYAGGPYPPGPAAYDVEPRPPYPYAVSSGPNEYRPAYEPAYEYDYYRPSHEYEVSPRPPAPVPSGYYSSGYPE